MVRLGPLRARVTNRGPGRPALARRSEVARFGSLLGLLILTIVAIGLAARPDTWRFFQSLDSRPVPPARPVPGPLPGKPAAPATAEDPLILAQRDPAPGARSGAADDRTAVSPGGRRTPDGLAVINPDIVRGVKDWTKVIPARPYYDLLALAAHTPPAVLERHARRDVLMANLKNDPEKYRGQLIYLEGHLQRLVRDPHVTSSRHPDLKVRYEGWLFTADSGTNPYVVVTTHVPEGMPTGPDVRETVSVAGYFLEWWFYTTREGTYHPAPIIIGNRLVWHPAPPVGSRASRREFLLVILIGLAGLAIIGIVVNFLGAQRRSRQRRRDSEGRLDPDTLEHRESGPDWERLRWAEEASGDSAFEPGPDE